LSHRFFFLRQFRQTLGDFDVATDCVGDVASEEVVDMMLILIDEAPVSEDGGGWWLAWAWAWAAWTKGENTNNGTLNYSTVKYTSGRWTWRGSGPKKLYTLKKYIATATITQAAT
jgi:hypothetical protein